VAQVWLTVYVINSGRQIESFAHSFSLVCLKADLCARRRLRQAGLNAAALRSEFDNPIAIL
jgi:hypothetical protein